MAMAGQGGRGKRLVNEHSYRFWLFLNTEIVGTMLSVQGKMFLSVLGT